MVNTQIFARKQAIFLSLLLLFCLTGLPVKAQTPSQTSEASQVRPLDTPLTPAALVAFWDGFFDEQMDRFNVPGALMVVVQDDAILWAKGYGYADLTEARPMDSEQTIIRSGSIVKTVTATALMQLAEQGKLDLDADVNVYLTEFQIPATFAEPVTARHLINMTAGFDTHWLGIRASSAAELKSLGQYLAENMPPRVQPPGRYRRYNDHEIALAGYLVEMISGMPYEQYLQQAIFQPLEMDDSTVLLPAEQHHRVTFGYPVDGGAADAYPLSYYYLNTAPGSGFNTTAIDLGHYMIAHLQQGAYQRPDGTTAEILQPKTMQQMHQTAFAYHPRLVGQVNSFDEQVYQGVRYLKKAGGAPGMQNMMLLFPEQGLGFYLFTNTDGHALRNNWWDAVLDQYLAANEFAPISVAAAPAQSLFQLKNVAGHYLEVSDSTSETEISRIQALLNAHLWRKVTASADGTLYIDGQGPFSEVSPGLWQHQETGSLVAFAADSQHRATALFEARTAYARMGWYETPTVQLGLLAFATLVFICGTLVAVVRLKRKGGGQWLAGLISGLNLIFLVGLGYIFLPLLATNGPPWQFTFGPPLALRLVLIIPVVTAWLTGLLLARISVDWWHHRQKMTIRVLNTVIAIASIGFIFFLHSWNLLGHRF